MAAVAERGATGKRSTLWTVTVVLAILGMVYGLLTAVVQVLVLAGVQQAGPVLWVLGGLAGPVAFYPDSGFLEGELLIPAFLATVAFGAFCVETVSVGRSSRGQAKRWPQIVTGALAGVVLLTMGLWGLSALVPIIHLFDLDAYFSDVTSVGSGVQVVYLVESQVMLLVLLAWVVVAIIWAAKRAPRDVAHAHPLPVAAAGGGVGTGVNVRTVSEPGMGAGAIVDSETADTAPRPMLSPDGSKYWDGSEWVLLPGRVCEWDGSEWKVKPSGIVSEWNGTRWIAKPVGVKSLWNGTQWMVEPAGRSEWNGTSFVVKPAMGESEWNGSEWLLRPDGRVYWTGTSWRQGFSPTVKWGALALVVVVLLGAAAGVGIRLAQTNSEAAQANNEVAAREFLTSWQAGNGPNCPSSTGFDQAYAIGGGMVGSEQAAEYEAARSRLDSCLRSSLRDAAAATASATGVSADIPVSDDNAWKTKRAVYGDMCVSIQPTTPGVAQISITAMVAPC